MKKIILGITGGIAAYKVADLASTLVKQDYDIHTVFTNNAREFIGTETFRALTGNQVVNQNFNSSQNIPHISLLDGDPLAIVIAPATANIIGKIAGGIADDILTTTIMAAPKIPKIIIPSMNTEMWENPILQENIKKLQKLGYIFVDPDYGRMACGTIGKGRYPDNQLIIDELESLISKKNILSGKNILIVSGGTREAIDDVRVITNLSTGKMGRAIEGSAIQLGAKTTFIDASQYSVAELDQEIQDKLPDNDILIMPAAISDYTIQKNNGKIKTETLTLELSKTKDILKPIKGIFKVGFALEEKSNILKNGKKKLKEKNLNIIVANSLETLGSDSIKATIITNNESLEISGSKKKVATTLLEKVADEFTSYIYENAVCS